MKPPKEKYRLKLYQMRIEKLFGCLVKSYTCRSDKDNNPIYLDVLKHNASSLVFPVVQIWCHVYFIIENKILATYVHNGHCIVIWLPFVDLILRVFSNPTHSHKIPRSMVLRNRV